MSTAVLPSLPGLTFSVMRDQQWSNDVQENISGKEVRIAYWSAPRYTWTLTFEFLRSDSFAEFQALFGFFSARQGRFDSFLYTDIEDNSVTGQLIGHGDGLTKTFQLMRVFGNGTPEPILAPNAVSAVYLNGVVQAGGSYTVGAWGSAVPGVITFAAAPGNLVPITGDFTFYFPVRFDADVCSFENFMAKLWATKELKLVSLK